MSGDVGTGVLDSSELPAKARALLDAVIAISTDLDLHNVLTRIVESASQLTDARYGALGVIGPDGDLTDFITTGIDESRRASIGDPPHGQGILGLLIDRPEPIRLDDLSQHPDSHGFPPNHPQMRTFLGVPVRVRGTVFGNLYLTEKRGGLSFTSQDQMLVQGLAGAAGFVIENARTYGLSERRRQWLEATAELVEAVQPPTTIEEVLERLTAAAHRITGAATAIVSREDAAPLVVSSAGSFPASLTPGIAELASADAFDPEQLPAPLTLGTHTIVTLPLRAHLVGPAALVLAYPGPANRPALEDLEQLASFAEQASLALDRVQAIDDREALAVITERERIARDLHDVVIQRLFATGMQLQALDADALPVTVQEALERSVDALDQTVREIRSTIFDLQSRGDSSARSEVRGLLREYSEVLGFTPRLTTTGPLDAGLTDPVRSHLLAILREALSNIARHAEAQHAEVVIRVSASELVVEVTDDGKGLPEGRHERGLQNVRGRAEALEGVLELEAHQPHGTVLRWTVPL